MPSMAGKTFGKLAFHLPQATAYGLVQSRSRRCLLNPPAETLIDPRDEIVMIRATDLSEADMLPLPEPVPMDLGARPGSTRPAPMTVSMLSLQLYRQRAPTCVVIQGRMVPMLHMGAKMKRCHLNNVSERSGVTLTCHLYRVKRASLVEKKSAVSAGDWHPSVYKSAGTMTATSLDWGDQGPSSGQTGQGIEPAELPSAFVGPGNGLAATVMQERQASYMYIMPQEHIGSKDSPEVSCTAPC